MVINIYKVHEVNVTPAVGGAATALLGCLTACLSLRRRIFGHRCCFLRLHHCRRRLRHCIPRPLHWLQSLRRRVSWLRRCCRRLRHCAPGPLHWLQCLRRRVFWLRRFFAKIPPAARRRKGTFRGKKLTGARLIYNGVRNSLFQLS